MKLYDFVCQNCKHTFEDLQTTDEEDIYCPNCLSIADRLISFNPTKPHDPKMAELCMKFRKSEKKYANTPKENRPRL